MSKIKTKLSRFLLRHPHAAPIAFGALMLCACAGILFIGGRMMKADAEAAAADLRSPQYEAQPLTEAADFMPDDAVYHTSDEGVVTIPSPSQEINDEATPRSQLLDTDDTDKIWEADQVVSFNSFTTQAKVKQADGSIGVLTIPSLSLSVNVYASENELESMTKGLGHFSHSSSWDGNIAICGHNVNYDLSDGYFKNLHTLKAGDEITFSTSLGERRYQVSSIAEIAEDDWSGTARSSQNKISMITCITGKPNMRLMVVATQV